MGFGGKADELEQELNALLLGCRADDADDLPAPESDPLATAAAASAAERRDMAAQLGAAQAGAATERWRRAQQPLQHAAAVYTALDLATSRILAAKRLAAPAAVAPAAAAWPAARLRLLGALRHPNLVWYMPPPPLPAAGGAGETGTEAYRWAVMELCDAGSVEGLLGLYGVLPSAVVRRCAPQRIVGALAESEPAAAGPP